MADAELSHALDLLVDEPRWLTWRLETRDSKPTKVPYTVLGKLASSTDPATWDVFDACAAKARDYGSNGGVGIVLGDLGNDLFLAGIDLDSSLIDGVLSDWAQPFLDAIPSYAEVSPSGTGLKAYFHIEADNVRPFLDLCGSSPQQWGFNRSIPGFSKKDHGPGIELYTSHRYFAYTGRLWPGSPDRITTLDWDALEQLAALIPTASNGHAKVNGGGAVNSHAHSGTNGGGRDNSRSAIAKRKGAALKRAGKTFEQMCEALRADPETADWVREKGEIAGQREMRRIWDRSDGPSDTEESIREAISKLRQDDVSGATAIIERIAAIRLPPLTIEDLIKAIRDKTSIRAKAIDQSLSYAKKENSKKDGDDESQATEIVTLVVQSGAVLFHNKSDDAFADITIINHRETWPIRSKALRSWLTKIFYDKTASAPNSESLSAAVNVLEAMAHFDGKEIPVWLRVGEYEGKIYLDLCDTDWRAIEIDTDGWRIVTNPPVRFRRTAGMLPLPEPAQDGDIKKLRELVNVPDNNAFVLTVAFQLGALNPRGPYADLALNGDHGAAKTSFARTVRDIVDPHSLPPRSLPREDRDLFLAAKNGWLLAFDNVSGLPDWLSDSLCRLSTGGGFATRQLYTDDEECLFEAMRPVILNGIEDFVVRADLADRSLLLTLKRLDKPITETELRAKFKEAHPAILGALLNAVSHGLKMLPETKLEQLPRMADFALWVSACEGALWKPGEFLKAYEANRAEMIETVLDADTVASAIRKFMEKKASWEGSAALLLESLALVTTESERHERKWPRAAHALSGRLRRAATGLREAGIDVQFVRSGDHANTKKIELKKRPQKSDRKHPRATAERPQKPWETAAADAADASDAFFPTKKIQSARPKSVDAWEQERAPGVPEVREKATAATAATANVQEPQKSTLFSEKSADALRTLPRSADAPSVRGVEVSKSGGPSAKDLELWEEAKRAYGVPKD